MVLSSARNVSMPKNAKKEPIQCLKCHGWGHLSYDCMQCYDTCRTCAGRHHTTDCTDSHHPWCISCQMEGHPSWDQQCPTFTHKCEKMSSRLTENHMPYFPTNKPWTHVIQPPRLPYQRAPMAANGVGHAASPQRTTYRQTTLQFQTSQQQPRTSSQPIGLTDSAHRMLLTGSNGVEQGQMHRWGSRDGDKELPPTSFI